MNQKKKVNLFSLKKIISKKKPLKNYLLLMKLSKIISKLISSFERKLVHEIIQPVGATKRPQESLLNNFIEKAKNFEEHVIYSIFFYVLNQ